MRRLIAIFSLSLAAAGCNGGGGHTHLEPLARGLSDAMQPAYAELRLEIVAKNDGDRVALHCVLRNVSIAATPVNLEPSTLPWRNPDFFEIHAVTASGKVVHRSQEPIELGPASELPSPLTVTPGNAIEGDMFLHEMPNSGLPTNEDLLLIWSTLIRVSNSDAAEELRGVTFLKAASTIGERRASLNTPEAAKVIAKSSGLDEPFYNPPGGTWTPDTAIVSEMKVAVASTLQPFFSERGRVGQPVRYWFQYLGHGSGGSKTIDIHGRPFPVLPQADTKAFFFGPWIPEACIVHARYVPSQRRIENLMISGFCPPHI